MVSVPGPEEHGMDISTEVVSHSAGEYCTFKKVLSYYHPHLISDVVLEENVSKQQIIIEDSSDTSHCKTHTRQQSTKEHTVKIAKIVLRGKELDNV
jgi:hypothetical protein